MTDGNEEIDRVERATQVLDAAAKQGFRLAALGGVAIRLLAPSARPGGPWARPLADIDFASVSADRRKIETLLLEHRLEPEADFNLVNGHSRLRYIDADGSHVDVFLNEMRLCHLVAWQRRLAAGMRTLPLPELFLTKLQVHNAEAKDLGDLAALLQDAKPADSDLAILLRAVRNDWGLWRTTSANLQRLVDEPRYQAAQPEAQEWLRLWSSGPFSLGWRARSTVGDRIPWYDTPEED
jgi:hypothetical protein